ncbi:MAG: hypothetical protein A2Y33_11370 [Spirochaetes bacterium GWF1_51_8]|nr:MAG: hypothetical protein A2Y33_11370 [Spirochaetes bacterium GWF1_51_8]
MKKLFVLFFTVFFFIGCQTGEKALLRMNLQKDDTFTFITETRQTIIQTVDKKAMEIEQIVHNEFEYLVESVDEKTNYNLKIVFKNITIDMNADGMKMKMSSDTNGLPDDLATRISSKMLNSMVDMPFNVVIDHLGEVVEVKNLETLFNNMFASLSELDKDAEEVGKQLSQSISSMVSPDNIKEMMRQNFNAFPVQPVGVGDSWVSSVEVKTGFPMSMSMNNKIVKMDKSTTEVEYESSIKSSTNTSFIEMGGMKMGFEIKTGLQKGSYIIDNATGMAKSALIDMNFEAVVTIQGDQAQSIPMSIKGTTIMKMK